MGTQKKVTSLSNIQKKVDNFSLDFKKKKKIAMKQINKNKIQF